MTSAGARFSFELARAVAANSSSGRAWPGHGHAGGAGGREEHLGATTAFHRGLHHREAHQPRRLREGVPGPQGRPALRRQGEQWPGPAWGVRGEALDTLFSVTGDVTIILVPSFRPLHGAVQPVQSFLRHLLDASACKTQVTLGES